MTTKIETAILAGGCFWGMEDLLRRYPGVLSTRVGYTGGDVPNATYRNHGTHAEAIEIVFDPRQIGYRQILEIFFQIHDPTTVNRQGNDIGTSYRSAIFYLNAAQKHVAEDTVADVDASGLWPGKVVTEIVAAGPFWEAEAEHQNYLERLPNGYTCHFIRPEWKLPKRSDGAAASAGSATTSGYNPISCEFHDLLEAHATTRKEVQIRFRDGERALQERRAAIVDVFAREGAEYLVLNTGETLRLDQLIEVDNARLADF